MPEPLIRHETNGLWVEFGFLKGETTQETEDTTQEMIKVLMRANPHITRQLLADKTGLTADGIKYHLQKMSGKPSSLLFIFLGIVISCFFKTPQMLSKAELAGFVSASRTKPKWVTLIS